MRLAWPPPRHLIASVLIAIAALALIHLSPSYLQEMLSAVSLVLIFLIPGYLAVLWARPARGDLTRRRRAGLSIASSCILAGLVGLILMATPRGLQSASLATILSLLSIFLAAVAYARWSDLPRNKRFLIQPRTRWRQTPARSTTLSSKAASRRSAYAALILALCFIAALALTFGPYRISLGDFSSGSSDSSSNIDSGEDGGISARYEAWPSTNLSEDRSESREDQFLIAGSAATNSTGFDDERKNATQNNASANSSAKISSTKNRPTFFGGGGGGSASTESSTVTSEKAQPKETAPPTVDDVEVADDSPAPEESSNLSSTLGPANQTVNSAKGSIENQSSEQNLTAPGLAPGISLAPSAVTEETNDTALESPALMPQAKSGASAGTTPSEPSSAAQASSSLQNLSGGDESSTPALTGSKAAIGQPINQSNSTDVKDSVEAENATAAGLSDEDQTQANASSNANNPPVLESLVPDKTSPQPPGTAIFWRAKATDEEGERILYKFLLDGKQANNWSRIASWNLLTAGLAPGDHQITVLVRDENHADESSYDDMMNASFSLNPINLAPLLQDLKPDSTSPKDLGGSVTWTASATDPDNDPIYYKFLKNGQEVAAWSRSSSWTWETASEDPGEYRISVIVRDGLHAPENSFDSSKEVTFSLIRPNYIPVISSLDADRPGPQPQGSIITWTAAARDPEGDLISYRFLVDGREASEWSESSSWALNTSSLQPGEHEIRAEVRDGKHSPNGSFDSFKVAAFNISETNLPPVLTDLTPDISSPQAQGADVTWTAEAQDPEGDPIFYKFQLNGRDMTGWSESATWRWSSKGQSIGEHLVRALARDGLHAPESSYDSSKESTFTLVSEIDMQIANLQRNR